MIITIFISLYYNIYFKANLVKKFSLVKNNSQITKHYYFYPLYHTMIFRRFKCSLVGISETTRSTTNLKKIKFNQ